jgi:hypothetical protein
VPSTILSTFWQPADNDTGVHDLIYMYVPETVPSKVKQVVLEQVPEIDGVVMHLELVKLSHL